MRYLIKIIFAACSLALICGCASSVKFNSILTRNTPSTDKAEIKVTRSTSWVGAETAVGIQDNVTSIGELGPGGELHWYRQPGYMALIMSNATYNPPIPAHVIIIPVEAGKSYLFDLDLFHMKTVPVNFPKELVAYELSKIPLPNALWKAELKRLTSNKGR